MSPILIAPEDCAQVWSLAFIQPVHFRLLSLSLLMLREQIMLMNDMMVDYVVPVVGN